MSGDAIMAQLAQHGPLASLVLFFTMFLGFALWAYLPRNKARFESYGLIPLSEPDESDDSSSDTRAGTRTGTGTTGTRTP